MRWRASATLVHTALALLPLALVVGVAWRVSRDSCNHLGVSPLNAALALLVALVVAGALRCRWLRALDALALVALVPGAFAVGVAFVLDRCDLLIGYGDFTRRHLPDANAACCAQVPRMPACRAAEAAREYERRQRSLLLAQGILPPELAAAQVAEDVEVAFVALEERAKLDAEAAARNVLDREAQLRREATRKTWLAATRARLVALRDSGADFSDIGPAAEDTRLRESGKPRPNGCAPNLDTVRSRATPTGWFVPVAAQDDSLCSFELWFVPRPAAAPSEPVASALVFEEFDLAFTVSMVASDFDDDGALEAVLVRGWAHPEGVGDGHQVVVVEASGEVRETPFTGVRELDGDGRLDVELAFSQTTNGMSCAPNEVWNPRYLVAPTFALRAVGGGRFSLADPLAREQWEPLCRAVGPLGAAERDGRTDEHEVARRLLCRLADGEPRAALAAELAAVCSQEESFPDDCPKARPGVCLFHRTMAAWLEGSSPFASSP